MHDAHASRTSATDLLATAADIIDERAHLRDQPSGERSMARTVAAFNAMYDQRLTEQQGWQFMVLLKMARAAGGTSHLDDFTDEAAYAALAGESVARRLTLGELPHSFNHKPFAPT